MTIVEECNKLLGIGQFQEHDDMPYCRGCYGKLFGPKGYGFAGGSAGLSANRDDNNGDDVQMRWEFTDLCRYWLQQLTCMLRITFMNWRMMCHWCVNWCITSVIRYNIYDENQPSNCKELYNKIVANAMCIKLCMDCIGLQYFYKYINTRVSKSLAKISATHRRQEHSE